MEQVPCASGCGQIVISNAKGEFLINYNYPAPVAEGEDKSAPSHGKESLNAREAFFHHMMHMKLSRGGSSVGGNSNSPCSSVCGQIVINNEGGTVIINCNCCGGEIDPCFQVESVED
jgi:hypothetical protein